MAQTVTTTSFAIGPAVIAYGGNELGATAGGVTIEMEELLHLTKVDQWGDTPVKAYVSGHKCIVKTKMREISAAKLALISQGMVNNSGVLDWGAPVGVENAGATLVITPFITTLAINQWTIRKAVAAFTKELNYEVDSDAEIEVTFTGMIDSTQSSGEQMLEGTNSGDTTAPTVSSSTPAESSSNYGAAAVSISVVMSENVYATNGTAANATKHVALWNATDDALVTISAVTISTNTLTITHSAIGANKNCVLLVMGLADKAGNVMSPAKIEFTTAS